MPKPTSIAELHRRVEALPPGKRLMLAAHLMLEGKAEVAIAIAENVVHEHQAAQLLRRSAAS